MCTFENESIGAKAREIGRGRATGGLVTPAVGGLVPRVERLGSSIGRVVPVPNGFLLESFGNIDCGAVLRETVVSWILEARLLCHRTAQEQQNLQKVPTAFGDLVLSGHDDEILVRVSKSSFRFVPGYLGEQRPRQTPHQMGMGAQSSIQMDGYFTSLRVVDNGQEFVSDRGVGVDRNFSPQRSLSLSLSMG